MKIMIRYNTDKDRLDANLPPWRVIVEGHERLANRVTIHTKTWTTLDEIAPGLVKWHITCEGNPQWDSQKNECIIL